MSGRMNLARRIEALEGGAQGGWKPHCWLTARDDETRDEAIARHKAEEGCVEDSGGHIVWCVFGSRAAQERNL